MPLSRSCVKWTTWDPICEYSTKDFASLFSFVIRSNFAFPPFASFFELPNRAKRRRSKLNGVNVIDECARSSLDSWEKSLEVPESIFDVQSTSQKTRSRTNKSERNVGFKTCNRTEFKTRDFHER